jgi:soluble lytic murein transglycosylase
MVPALSTARAAAAGGADMLTRTVMRRLIFVLVLSLVTVGCGAGPGMLHPFSPRPPEIRFDNLADKRAAFARTHESFRRGAFEQALPICTALVTQYPELIDYHLYCAGVSQARLGHDQEAETALTRLLGSYPQSVVAPAGQLELGTLLLRSGRVDQARWPLQQALTAPDTATAQAARVVLAEADERSGDIAAAHAAFMRVRRDAVGSSAARAAKEHVRALRAAHPELSPAGVDLAEEAHLLVAEHDYAAAKVAVEQLSQQAVAEVEMTDLLRVLADALYGLGETERALAVLREVADRFPASAAAPEVLFRRASILWNRDQDEAALEAFEEFRHRYPVQQHAAEALYATGRIHERAAHTTVALATYAELARRYPRSKLAGEARWRMGWIQYQSRNWQAAAKTFSELAGRIRGPQRNAAAYWQARSLEHVGRTSAARQLYREIISRDRNDYYAMWAERSLGAPVPKQVTAERAVPEPVVPSPAPLTDTFHLTRWEELKATGVYELARGELAVIERDHGHDTAVTTYLLRAYQTVDGYAAALRLLRRLDGHAGLSPVERERLLYPLAFWSTVSSETHDRGVDPLLVEALMRQESVFDPEARSPADAHGLMQLLPATAQAVATPSDGPVDRADLTRPELNIQLGVRYLSTLLTRFHGDVLKAAAAYNGGEAAVEKWERRFAALEADEFVEAISFRETRDYVKRVVTNYRTYQHLYGVAAR